MQEYGGFWIRVGAYIIDYIVLQIVSVVLMMIVFGGLSLAQGNEDAMTGGMIGFYVVSLIINWLYSAILESSEWQGTIGKKAVGLIVVNEAGERIGFGRATGRYFAKIISGLILLIGFFMIGWTERKQGLHDIMASTFVLKARSPSEVVTSAKVFE